MLVNEARLVEQLGLCRWEPFAPNGKKVFVFMFTSCTTFTFPLLMGVGDGELRGEGSGSAFTALRN